MGACSAKAGAGLCEAMGEAGRAPEGAGPVLGPWQRPPLPHGGRKQRRFYKTLCLAPKAPKSAHVR